MDINNHVKSVKVGQQSVGSPQRSASPGYYQVLQVDALTSLVGLGLQGGGAMLCCVYPKEEEVMCLS